MNKLISILEIQIYKVNIMLLIIILTIGKIILLLFINKTNDLLFIEEYQD
jgi:hypothetical protein